MIPLSEPALQGKELEYVTDCIESGWISSNGEYIGRMEEALADYLGVEHVVACNCGTSALHISLILAGVQPEDEVIVPTVTFIAPVNAVRYVGAWPVFLDCDEYCNMDVAALRRFLAEECEQRDGVPSTEVPDGVSQRSFRFTCSAPRPTWMPSWRRRTLSTWRSSKTPARRSVRCTRAGSAAASLAIGCLSFNGNKIVTSGGGGAILTNDEAVAKQARYLTTQAKEDGIEYIHHAVGYNYRMNNVLAAFGLAQLETLTERIAVKRNNFALYEQALGPGRLLQQPEWSDANRWFYAYLCSDADAKERVIGACIEAGIQVRPLWFPNHLQRPYVDCQAYQIDNAHRFLRASGESSVLGDADSRTYRGGERSLG